MSGEGAGAHGVLLPNGCRVTHGEGAGVKRPFADMPVVMHELSTGGLGDTVPYRGQFGFIPFNTDCRLPRHVHITGQPTRDKDELANRVLIAERILVLNGVGLVELNGEILLAAPGTLVEICPGVPHTWTACPPGLVLPDGTASDGSFLMVYEYSDLTGFFPVQDTTLMASAAEYEPYDGDLEAIRFPELDARQVAERAPYVWDRDVRRDLRVGN
jgi:hypothetical protein